MEKQIPKIIHYCWFGGAPLPELAQKCIASWKKFLPNYEIKEWNESNFDVNQIPYTKQAYKSRKYAFVSDYARFKIMYEYGGIYFDTDVEVIKPLDNLIAKGAFFGMEQTKEELFCAPGLGFACNPGLTLCKEMIDYYKDHDFILPNKQYDLTTVVRIFSKLLNKRNFIPASNLQKFQGIFFYPPEYFCPINYYTGKKNFTSNTHTVHHYAASWVDKNDNLTLLAKIWKFFRLPNTDFRKIIIKLTQKKTKMM